MSNRRWFASALACASFAAACGDQSTTAPNRAIAPQSASASVAFVGAPITITSGLSAVLVSTDNTTWYSAFVIPTNPAWDAAVGGGSYVASYVGAESTGPADAVGPEGITRSTYKSSFTLPDGAVDASITVSAWADNWAAVSLNGSTFGSMAYFQTYGQWALNFGGSMWSGWPYAKSPAATPYAFSTTTGFAPGANTLSFALENWGGPEGLSFSATVTYNTRYIAACSAVRPLVTQAGVATSLCAKLNAAAAAQLRGDLNAKAGALNAYRNEVSAQTSKFIPVANIPALLAIAANL